MRKLLKHILFQLLGSHGFYKLGKEHGVLIIRPDGYSAIVPGVKDEHTQTQATIAYLLAIAIWLFNHQEEESRALWEQITRGFDAFVQTQGGAFQIGHLTVEVPGAADENA